METKAKSNPVISFFKRIFEKLSNSAVFSILSTNASSTIGDDYLENGADFDAYKRQAADEAELTDAEYSSLEEAFRTASDNLETLERETTQIPSNRAKSGLDPITPDPKAEVVQRTPEGIIKDKNDDDERSL